MKSSNAKAKSSNNLLLALMELLQHLAWAVT